MKDFIITLKIVLNVLKSYKGRVILAIIGIFLGSLSLIIVFNVLASIKLNIVREVEKFGDKVITVASGQIVRAGRQKSFSIAQTMTLDDAKALKNSIIFIDEIAPYVKRTLTVRYGEKYITTNIIGTTNVYAVMRKLKLNEGSFFNEENVKRKDKVVVVGSEIKDKLSLTESLVGKHISINNTILNILGVIEKKGIDLNGNNLDDVTFVPIKTYMNRIDNLTYIDGMEIKIRSWDVFDDVKKGITSILRERHKLKEDMEDDFTIINPIDARRLRNEIVNLVDVLGKITSVISYMVGGLGIFSIMLLIVGLRKYEIGIKRAVGAKKRDIFIQFIYESTFITLTGAILGIMIGLMLSFIIYYFAKLPCVVSIKGVSFSFISCVLIGILSGLYPAFIAARLNPINIIK
jgi:putative ABC transport system permease protein